MQVIKFIIWLMGRLCHFELRNEFRLDALSVSTMIFIVFFGNSGILPSYLIDLLSLRLVEAVGARSHVINLTRT